MPAGGKDEEDVEGPPLFRFHHQEEEEEEDGGASTIDAKGIRDFFAGGWGEREDSKDVN